MSYSPLYIKGNETGLVQNREEQILPNDAYPVLQNAYVWRERIKRKRGCQLLGRLQRKLGTTDGAGNLIVAITPTPINSGIATFQIGTDSFTDPGGASPVTLLTNSLGTGTLDRIAGTLTIAGSIALTDVYYFPGLPVMGLRIREQQNSTNDQTIAFDQDYAYKFDSILGQWVEFLPGTTWNAKNAAVTAVDFFWSTNYWVSQNPPFGTANQKLFWVTNNTGSYGALADPIRLTDGSTWVDFSAANNLGKIDASNNYLVQCLAFLPYRGRLVAFNTWEGPNPAGGLNYSNRIRWSTIGNPLLVDSWLDDVRGKGGFLDIPTSEDIVAVGFVRDNLVIYCERSTWQLRYTGRSIAPFQIEKVNSELGAESTFSAVQFDTSLVGIGDKGVVECDSYKSERIDIKIPDLVFEFQDVNNGTSRVHGIRDFVNRLAFWTYVDPDASPGIFFPNKRLVYNYENDSWAIFDDSFTCFGNYQAQNSRNWLNSQLPWVRCNFPWIDEIQGDALILAGNQHGFVEILTQDTTNDVSLFIQNITGNVTTPTVINSPNHNLITGAVIQITGIPVLNNYDNLNEGVNPITNLPYNANNGVFGVIVVDSNNFQLMVYDPMSDQFSDPQLDPALAYQGEGFFRVRDNFIIQSKKFNFAEDGQSIQIGYIDLLMAATEQDSPGAISLNVYVDYNDSQATNTLPENTIEGLTPSTPDTFFNQVIPTCSSNLNNKGGTKFQQRVICPTRGNYLTLQYTFNNAQMAGYSGFEQEQDVQIDSQVIWCRPGGRLTQI